MTSEENPSHSSRAEVAQTLQQAYASFKNGQSLEAETICRDLLARHPGNPSALLMLGMIFIKLNRIGEAKPLLTQASKVAPNNANYMRQLATGLSHIGLHDNAAKCWQTLCALEPDNEGAFTNLGSSLTLTGKLKEAIKPFDKAVRINPNNIDARLNLGITLRKLGRSKEAEESLRKVLELQPKHEAASAQLGGLLQLEGRTEEAITIYKDGLRDAEGSEDLLLGLFGASFEACGPNYAIELLSTAVATNPDNPITRSFLGIMMDLLGGRREAEREFSHVKSHSPENSFLIESWFHARHKINPETQIYTLSNSGLAYSVKNAEIDGLYLEFGVWQGRSINFISSRTSADVHGFDSFEGIPEPWEGMPSGAYSTFGNLPTVNPNVILHKGWFEESLPAFLSSTNESVAFMNIDCDTYGSTKTIFDHLEERIRPGTVIVFDEYFCYPNWQDHEYKAFQEFIKKRGLQYEYLFFNFYTRQAGVKIKGKH